MSSTFSDMSQIIPPGEHGAARIVHDKPSGMEILRSNIKGLSLEYRTYTRLFLGSCMYMTDADFEQRSNRAIVREAHGDVLVAGLGIGLILVPILRKPEVSSVLVIEKHQDVIDLVGPALAHDKLSIECNDIFTWTAGGGRKWDTLYFDIWPDICTDNIKEINKLHSRFKNRKRSGGYMNSWCVEYLRSIRRRER